MSSSVVSNSQIKSFKRCRRKYWLQYVRKLVPRKYALTGARQLGTRVHGALDAYYPTGQVSDTEAAFLLLPKEEVVKGGLPIAMAYLNALRDSELAAAGSENETVVNAVLKEHDLAVAMVEGYDQWIQEEGADADLETVSKEQALRTPSPVAGVELIGKLDRVSRKISTGAIGFMDYKTVGDLQKPLKYLGMDEQFRQYALMQRLIAGEVNQEPVRFQIYRMLKRSKRTAAAKPPFFRDYEVYVNDTELRAFWERLHGEITEMLRFERMIEENPELHRGIAYPTPTTDCSWDCDFYHVCPLFDDDRSDPEHVLSMNFVVGDPHEHYGGQLHESESAL